MQLLPSDSDRYVDKNTKGSISQKKGLEDTDIDLVKTISNKELASGINTVYFTIDSDKSLVKVCVDLDRSFIRHEFDVLAIHDIKENLKQKGVEFASECIVYEVINQGIAKRFLEGNPQMAMIFPCDVVVYETLEGKRHLSALRPTILVEMSGSIQLKVIAKDIEEVLETIMKEAAK